MLKILITGPESTGKSTLAKAAADYYSCLWIAEYARTYLEKLNHSYKKDDLDNILLGQITQTEKQIIAAKGTPYLFCDTGPEVIYIWSQEKYGRVSRLIQQHIMEQHYDVRLICYPDLTWQADKWRETPGLKDRLALFDQYCLLHEANNWPYYIIKGQNNQRLNQLIQYVDCTK